MAPAKFQLFALVTLEVDLLFTTIKKTLFKKELWRYEAPKIFKTVLDVSTKEPDDSPPVVTAPIQVKWLSNAA